LLCVLRGYPPPNYGYPQAPQYPQYPPPQPVYFQQQQPGAGAAEAGCLAAWCALGTARSRHGVDICDVPVALLRAAGSVLASRCCLHGLLQTGCLVNAQPGEPLHLLRIGRPCTLLFLTAHCRADDCCSTVCRLMCHAGVLILFVLHGHICYSPDESSAVAVLDLLLAGGGQWMECMATVIMQSCTV